MGRKKSSSANKNVLLAGSVIIVIVLAVAINLPTDEKGPTYVKLASWDYQVELLNNTYVLLDVELSRLPNWPTVTFNTTTLKYNIFPSEDIKFTLIYNLTVRDDGRPVWLHTALAQKIYVQGTPVYVYLHPNQTVNNQILMNGTYCIERTYTLSVTQLENMINWGVPEMMFSVGCVKSPGYKTFDFSLIVGYKI